LAPAGSAGTEAGKDLALAVSALVVWVPVKLDDLAKDLERADCKVDLVNVAGLVAKGLVARDLAARDSLVAAGSRDSTVADNSEDSAAPLRLLADSIHSWGCRRIPASLRQGVAISARAIREPRADFQALTLPAARLANAVLPPVPKAQRSVALALPDALSKGLAEQPWRAE
jgi:hypothetical protein